MRHMYTYTRTATSDAGAVASTTHTNVRAHTEIVTPSTAHHNHHHPLPLTTAIIVTITTTIMLIAITGTIVTTTATITTIIPRYPKNCIGRCWSEGHCCANMLSGCNQPSCYQGCALAVVADNLDACNAACKAGWDRWWRSEWVTEWVQVMARMRARVKRRWEIGNFETNRPKWGVTVTARVIDIQLYIIDWTMTRPFSTNHSGRGWSVQVSVQKRYFEHVSNVCQRHTTTGVI